MRGAIVYDCEIRKAIKKKDDPGLPGIEYCGGWRDYEGMGISVIGVYDYVEDRYRVFCADNFKAFQDLVNSRKVIVGFNSLGFDNRLCEANGLEVPDDRSYDLLSRAWVAAGLGPKWGGGAYAGFGLDACAKANFGAQKSGHGAMAPVDWQRGNIGAVIDYCLNDVRLTKRLFDLVLKQGGFTNPKDLTQFLAMAKPEAC